MASLQVLQLENNIVSVTTNSDNIDKAEIQRFITNHREEILKYLEPSCFYPLCYKLGIPDILTISQVRTNKVEQLLSKMDEKNESEIYFEFLNILKTNPNHHMGHKYLFKQFVEECMIQQSKEIEQHMVEKISEVEELLDITDSHMQAALLSTNLITNDEFEKLQQKNSTKREKVREFITSLSTKGPIAHYLFFNEVLGGEKSTTRDQELYIELQLSTRKGKASTSAIEHAKVHLHLPKRQPHPLEASKCVRRTIYMKAFRLIRKYEQRGKIERKKSDEILHTLISTPDTPSDVKITALIESCNKLCYSKQTDLFHSRMKKAQEMCLQLHADNQNTQALEALCQWMYAKWHRCIGDYGTALQYVSNAYHLLKFCEPCEAHILVHYCHGNILQDRFEIETDIAIKLFDISISYGNDESYGLLVSHNRIRKAQKYLGTSSNNPGLSNTVKQEKLATTKILLDSFPETEEIQPRTQCLIEYTRSDFHRLSGNIEEATHHYRIALKLATEYELHFEKHSLHIRQHSLNLSIKEPCASCPFCTV